MSEEEQKEYFVIVEDSPAVLQVISHLIKKCGFEVITHRDGQDAKDDLQEHADKKIVGIISDIMMPKLDGLELLKWIRSVEKLKDIPYVIVTAHPQKEFVFEAKSLGVNSFLIKPVSANKIVALFKSMFPDRRFKMLEM